ncbi:MAG: tRNA lysidine(34) synthetase TilS, partial [Alphaproteobacteria bacterium]|nr:tRNA lysidine(34) synthetase TilS [Alphaproteobacteria bacterium]
MTLENFEKEITKFRLLDSENRFAVALSGGSDSMALAVLLNDYSKKNNKELVALIVDHNLRDNSSVEARNVSEIITNLGIKNEILTWAHQEISSNIQERAREARLSLLTEYCKTHKIKYLFTAHHKNDVAETFLMNMIRGSGIYGMSSIPSMTVYNDTQLLRPLLNFHKNTLRDYLLKKKVKWIEDPSNENKNFLRTKVRTLINSKEMSNIIPDYEMLVDRIALNAKNIARSRTAIENICEKEIKKNIILHQEGYVSLSYNNFFNLEEEIGLKILSSCLVTVSGEHSHKPRFNSLEKLYKHIKDNNTAKTLWGCETLVKKDIIYIYREIGKKAPSLKKRKETELIWDNRFT